MARRNIYSDEDPSSRNDSDRDQIARADSAEVEDKKPRFKKTKAVAKILGWLTAGLVAYHSVFVVDQTEHAVVTNFGNPKRVIVVNNEKGLNIEKLRKDYSSEGIVLEEGAGLKFKWPWQSVNRMDNRLRRWDGYPEEGPTKDKKNLWIDFTTRYSIEDPLKTLRKNGTESAVISKLSDIIDSDLRDALGENDLIELVRTDDRKLEVTEKELGESIPVAQIKKGRTKIMKGISDKSREVCHQYGIAIHDVGVLIKGLTYVASVKKEVENRMIKERTQIAEKYSSEGEGEFRSIMGLKEKDVKTARSEGYKKAKDIEGAADGAAYLIYANGFTNPEIGIDGRTNAVSIPGLNSDPEFYSFVRSMRLLQGGLGGDGKTTWTVGTDNPLIRNFTKYLKADFGGEREVKK